ncbi:haloacid dehalogenase [Bosea caraganae]|nr:haloacid dehalogenase [Bosea caraganae]
MSVEIHSIWLMPNPADGQFLAGLVADLSGRFGTPVFTPHLTVRGDTDLPVAALDAAIAEAASAVPAFSEAVARVETSDAYFRSFYARFAVAVPLAQLKQHLEPEAAEAFMPHVSLLYGFVPPSPKAEAAQEFQRMLAGRPIAFDRLCVVRSGQDVPISEWAVIRTARLAASPA